MHDRGLFEDKYSPAGTRVFKVIGKEPGEVGIVVWPKAWSTPAFIADLEREAKENEGAILRIV